MKQIPTVPVRTRLSRRELNQFRIAAIKRGIEHPTAVAEAMRAWLKNGSA